MKPRRFSGLAATTLAALAFYAAPPCRADFLDPASFAATGPLNISGTDAYVFNTSTDTLTDTTAGGTTIATGTTSNGIAVFDFTSVNITGGTFTVTGSNPLALLSQSNLSFTGGTLSANGGNGTSSTAGIGVGGGGNGGDPSSGSNGVGQGGGPGDPNAAGGGGFGGAGGAGYQQTGSGGSSYGNLTNQLVGGSGGGAASNNFAAGGGGAGGGAIELGAKTSGGILTINGGAVSAIGGSGANYAGGGGGSGGGIFLHADTVNLAGSNVLSVAGGSASVGGGGGAGQIAVLANNFTNSGTFNTSGGTSQYASPGGSFTFTGAHPLGGPASVPEPSSLALLGLMAGGFALYQVRRRKARPAPTSGD